MTLDMLPWITARATGFAALALMAGAMVAGLLVRTRTPLGSVRGSGVVDLHRHLSLLALVATAVHGLALWLDSAVEIPAIALVVPGLGPYRPVSVGIGVVAAEIALLVHLSFRVRRRIGARAWRRVHWLVYAAFVGAVLHGIGSGTDTGRPWAAALYGGLVGAVAGLTGWRAATARRATRPAARARGSGQTRPMADAVTAREVAS